MERLTDKPLSHCVSCGYISHDVKLERCPKCGRGMHIEEPEAHWFCAFCSTIAWAGEEEEEEAVPLK
jgi:hypothetical protein